MKTVLCLLILAAAICISFQKATIDNQKEIIQAWADQANSMRVTQWEGIPKSVTEYQLDTVFTFWGNEKSVVKGKQIFKVR